MKLAPITIIYGQNGSGKSSILQSLQLLKQSFGGSIGYNGQVQFRNFEDVIRVHSEKLQIKIKFYAPMNLEMANRLGEIFIQNEFSHSTRERMLRERSLGYEIKFNPNKISQAILLGKKPLAEVQVSEKGNELIWPHFVNLTPRTPESILNLNAFTAVYRTEGTNDEEYRQSMSDFNRVVAIIRFAVEELRETLARTFLLTVQRGNVPWSAPTGGTPRDVGIHGETLVSLLALVFGRPEYANVRKKIIEWAEKFGMPDLYAGWGGGNQLEASFRDPQVGTSSNLSVAGHGSKQILTVITQVFFSPEGSTICIEEPEMSLHTALLPELLKLFSEAIKMNKQIVLTTHSSTLPAVLKRCVPKFLSHQDVRIYHLDKGEDGTKSRSLKVNEQGVIEGFIPSIKEAEKKIINM